MSDAQRKWLAACMLAALAALLWAYRHTFAGVLDTWNTNASFSHGFLIIPIFVWLVWRKRAQLLATNWKPSWLGGLAVVACGAAWIVGRGVGVLGVEQFAAFAMVSALTLAILGWDVTRALSLPLVFLMFAVPVGHAIVPSLMYVTADVATWALQASGVPILRSGMYLSIPAGSFEVARACSGLNYVITGLVLGVLFAYLTYSGWRKRLLAILAFLVIPVAANGVRVYLTILTSHLTDMRFGPGQEHVMFGRVFFIVVMLVMFWIGQRWRDDTREVSAPARSPAGPNWSPWVLLPALLTVPAILGGPLYLKQVANRVEARLAAEQTQLHLPAGAGGWVGPDVSGSEWKPDYSGARIERSGSYRDVAGQPVDAFVGVYGIGMSGGSEMINYNNRISLDEATSLSNELTHEVKLSGGSRLSVRERIVADHRGSHLVWYWFMVGDRPLTSRYAVKAAEARSFLLGGAVTERVVTLATPADAEGTARLESFAAEHAACVAAAFAFEACGQ